MGPSGATGASGSAFPVVSDPATSRIFGFRVANNELYEYIYDADTWKLLSTPALEGGPSSGAWWTVSPVSTYGVLHFVRFQQSGGGALPEEWLYKPPNGG